MSQLFSPLVLRSGTTIANRIAKAAMEENMAGSAQLPDERLISLYRRWGAGGAGLLITGNVMVHAEALTGPAGVVLDDRAPLESFTRWAQAGKAGGAAVWMQISHPGRQVQARMPGVVWGTVGDRGRAREAQQAFRAAGCNDKEADRGDHGAVRDNRRPR